MNARISIPSTPLLICTDKLAVQGNQVITNNLHTDPPILNGSSLNKQAWSADARLASSFT